MALSMSRFRLVIPLAACLSLLPVAAMAEGMPQLDFKNPLTLDQVWWGAVIFFVFFLLSWLWGLPKVAAVLDQRAGAIAADLDTARSAKTDADRAASELTEATAKARAEAQAAINAALDATKEQAAAQAATLNERLERELKEAEARIEAARAQALEALREVAHETAGTVVQRLTGSPPDAARLDHAVGAALAARGQKEAVPA